MNFDKDEHQQARDMAKWLGKNAARMQANGVPSRVIAVVLLQSAIEEMRETIDDHEVGQHLCELGTQLKQGAFTPTKWH